MRILDALATLAEAEWGDFGTAGIWTIRRLHRAVRNYYHTNAIARASETMARVSRNCAAQLTEATGTDG